MEKPKYYFVLASTQFLVEEEPFEEVLRERTQYYTRTRKRIDFWLLPKPQFLQATNFAFLQEKVPFSSLAVVSSNKIFITWLKLRLNNVIVGEFSGPSQEVVPFSFNKVNKENITILDPLDFLKPKQY